VSRVLRCTNSIRRSSFGPLTRYWVLLNVPAFSFFAVAGFLLPNQRCTVVGAAGRERTMVATARLPTER
jgi:hypothetical protein